MRISSSRRGGETDRAGDQRVWATPAALDAIAQLRAEMGQLILRHPGGREGEVDARLVTMPTQAARTEFCLGIVGGVPFHVDCKEDAALGYPDFEVLVETEPCQRLISRAMLPREGER